MNSKNNAIHLHIIGGFLGSGKTTAIIGAAKYLAGQGIRVGVITNDQGRHLVDTAIIRAQNIPAMEVTGGCFCCNFDDLNQNLRKLVDDHSPDVIFAESVGSCADVVATVVKPLLELEVGTVKPNSYSVFTDIRLFRRFLLGLEMPFSDAVNYIFAQQIEEAGLLVINKSDLLPQKDIDQVLQLTKKTYKEKTVLLQNSLNDHVIQKWVDALQADVFPLPKRSLEIDYDRYAVGERRMAWVDRIFELSASPLEMPTLLMDILTAWQSVIADNAWKTGHVKVALQADRITFKLSLAQSELDQSKEFVDFTKKKDLFKKENVMILLNVLVEGDLDQIVAVMENVIAEEAFKKKAGLEISHSFNRQPGYPKPTHRISN